MVIIQQRASHTNRDEDTPYDWSNRRGSRGTTLSSAGTVNGAGSQRVDVTGTRGEAAPAGIMRLVVQGCFSTRARIRRVCVAGEKVVFSRSRQ
jgi:hypothetical protein